MAGEIRRVVIDLGTGDGRWLYRHARQHPEVICIGIDAAVDGVREVARRARRRPERGGAPNLTFVRSAAEALPGDLVDVADEVHIQFPWGSLLRAVVVPEPDLLRRIAGLLKTGGTLHLVVNLRALADSRVRERFGIPSRPLPVLHAEMVSSYAAAGLVLRRWEVAAPRVRSAWGGRLGQGAAVPALVVEAEKR